MRNLVKSVVDFGHVKRCQFFFDVPNVVALLRHDDEHHQSVVVVGQLQHVGVQLLDVHKGELLCLPHRGKVNLEQIKNFFAVVTSG